MNYLLKFHIVLCVILTRSSCTNTDKNPFLQSPLENEIVEHLVRQWAPLVWLAPNEKYHPGSVSTFMKHVHAEEAKPGNAQINDIADINNFNKYTYLYENENELTYYDPNKLIVNNRNKRNFKDPSNSLDYLFDLPFGDESKNWFLVTNNDVDELLTDKNSFLYGENPTNSNVPIYAVISTCKGFPSQQTSSSSSSLSSPSTATSSQSATSTTSHQISNNLGNEVVYNAIDRVEYKKNPYIPISKDLVADYETSPHEKDIGVQSPILPSKNSRLVRSKRSNLEESTPSLPTTTLSYSETQMETKENQDELDSGDWKVVTERRDEVKVQSSLNEIPDDYPHFHVTYWMFYPYSQGKTICTLDLGPLGPLPIPLIFGMCLGTKKEFGNHVGDWEHMSLSFKGRKEPDEMYVSAHDSGAFYSYERLTGTFEYKRQETREGYLQRPIFPKTVITTNNHPVLFAAEGSHGLWTAPGKHKYVRVPRLYDINGFGIPWSTWNNVEYIYDNNAKARFRNPKWLKYRGHWGNSKSKCHPLKKIGLHFCELSDGPLGIPMKRPNFLCKKR